jgi:hypothetical protein
VRASVRELVPETVTAEGFAGMLAPLGRNGVVTCEPPGGDRE